MLVVATPLVTDTTAIITLLIAFGGVAARWLYRRGGASKPALRSQLYEKDAIIATNRQTIDSFEDRIKALETDLRQVMADAARAASIISELNDRLEVQINKYRSLEEYAAPQAVEHFQILFNEQSATILNRLEVIEVKLNQALSIVERGPDAIT